MGQVRIFLLRVRVGRTFAIVRHAQKFPLHGPDYSSDLLKLFLNISYHKKVSSSLILTYVNHFTQLHLSGTNDRGRKLINVSEGVSMFRPIGMYCTEMKEYTSSNMIM